MEYLENLLFDIQLCTNELNEYQQWINSKTDLKENAEISPFFKSHKYLSLLLGTYNPKASKLDKCSFQYTLFGNFICDLVVGDSTSKSYCFVEFEPAEEDSIFKKVKTKSTKEWGPKFEHGYSQIIDWFWALEDHKGSNDFRKCFGGNINYTGILVIGREQFFEDDSEKQRFEWRCEKVLTDSKKIVCVTYDQLYRDLRNRLDMYSPPSPMVPIGSTGTPPPGTVI